VTQSCNEWLKIARGTLHSVFFEKTIKSVLTLAQVKECFHLDMFHRLISTWEDNG
jgi:hypothetical protein